MFITSDIQNGVMLLTLHRPQALNALNREMLAELDRQLQFADADRNIRVVIITGEGNKAFAAGADIGELADLQTAEEGTRYSLTGQETFTRIESLSKPVIAAINGYALGGGLELALACDMRFASKSVKLGLPEITLGILPGFGGTQRLARLIGKGKANMLMMSGDPVNAEEALHLGLVDKVFESEQLLEKTKEFSGKLAKHSSSSLRAIKDCVQRGNDTSLEEGLAIESTYFGKVVTSDEGRKGIKNFLEGTRS